MTNDVPSGSIPTGPPTGPPPGPPSGPPQGPPEKERPDWLIPAAVIVVAAIIVGLVILNDSGDDEAAPATTTTSIPDGGGEIFLQPVAELGPDPFGPSAAAPAPSPTVPPGTPVTLGPPGADGAPPTAPVFTTVAGAVPPAGAIAVTARSGATPGLYGGTRDQSSCNQQAMIDYLAANPDKQRAWGEVQGLGPSQVGAYIAGLTPVLLRADTRVTNHGFKNGRPTRMQSVLQGGTAVLVDNLGVPRARCACGNPLLPPSPVDRTPVYQGTPWSGFNPGNVTVVSSSTTVINIITIIDITTGVPFGRPTGPAPGPDVGLPPYVPPPSLASSTTGVTAGTGPGGTARPPTTLPFQPTTTCGPTTTAGPTGDFQLVDSSHTVGELVNSWTVDDDAGTATISLPPNVGNYQWSVPQTLSLSGTQITISGQSNGNINVLISATGQGLTFSPPSPTVNVTNSSGNASSVVTPGAGLSEVKLVYSMGFSVTATYTYRR